MHLLKPQHLPNLPITQRRLPLIHIPHNRRLRTPLLEELLSRKRRSNSIIRSIKNLKPQSILLHTQITYLPQIPRVDITPRIP